MLKALFAKIAALSASSIGVIGGADGPTAVIVAENTDKALGFTTANIGEALLCSVAGMVGIFIVVGIIILSVSVLNKLGTRNKKD